METRELVDGRATVASCAGQNFRDRFELRRCAISLYDGDMTFTEQRRKSLA